MDFFINFEKSLKNFFTNFRGGEQLWNNFRGGEQLWNNFSGGEQNAEV